MRYLAFVFAALCVLPSESSRAQDELVSLERGLVRRSPELVKYLKSKEYRNVGVLKFLVVKDGKKFSDNVGALNLLLARQLETALILSNDARSPIGIADNASAVAAKTRGGNHLSKEGREKLFGERYPLAWGRDKVSLDAFLTGTAEVSADLRTLTLSIFCFDRATNKLEQVGADLRVALRPSQLSDLGESFVLRGIFDGGKVEVASPANIVEHAVKTRLQEEKHPLETDAAPIRLRVFYGDREVRPEFRDGQAFLPEPREGDQVGLEIKCVAKQGRYGVVLKVNGENTIGREQAPDLHCTRWVLEAGEGPYTITGYQMDDNKALAFRVASRAESEQRAINYGADVGTITMTVFAEAKGKVKKKVLLNNDQAYETIVEKVQRPKEAAPNYHALKAQLLDEVNRGIVVEGHAFKSVVESVPFTPDPNPVMVTTLVYYKR